jgi:hypothetical protein
MKKILAALLLSLSLMMPAAATDIVEGKFQNAQRIQLDPGGSVFDYIEKYTQMRNMGGGNFKIDGLCISACTLITGLIPSSRVCATEYGILAFHSASLATGFGSQHSVEGTRLIWQLYPKKVQEMLKEKGWDGEKGDAHPDLIYIPATEVFKNCDA